MDGFSDRLLPSDRWQWSDVTGLQHQPLDSFQLPSDSWEWEGDWYVDENFEGEPTEKGVSVTFAYTLFLFHFNRSFLKPWCHFICRDGATPSTSLPSTPKIRNGIPASVAGDGSATGDTKPWTPGQRWVVFYVCLFVFTPSAHQHLKLIFSPEPPLLCAVCQIPSQHTTLPDPFSDISCGGWEINEEPRGRLSLWAVSLQGKVLSHTHTVILA